MLCRSILQLAPLSGNMLAPGYLLLCALAAIAGGFMDAISGGGGLISLTTLLLCGVPPHMALGTNKLGAIFGLFVSFYKFSRTSLIDWKIAIHGTFFMVAGSLGGALLALRLSPEVLGKAILALLPFAVIGILIPPQKSMERKFCDRKIMLPLFAFLTGCYDGFFGPGSGSFLILGLYLLFGLSLIEASATAKPFNLASALCSALYFIWNGAVYLQLALIMGICFMAGNWLGAIYAIRKGNKAVRAFLIAALVFLFLSLLWRYLLD